MHPQVSVNPWKHGGLEDRGHVNDSDSENISLKSHQKGKEASLKNCIVLHINTVLSWNPFFCSHKSILFYSYVAFNVIRAGATFNFWVWFSFVCRMCIDTKVSMKCNYSLLILWGWWRTAKETTWVLLLFRCSAHTDNSQWLMRRKTRTDII